MKKKHKIVLKQFCTVGQKTPFSAKHTMEKIGLPENSQLLRTTKLQKTGRNSQKKKIVKHQLYEECQNSINALT